VTLFDIPLKTIDDRPTTLAEHAGRTLLIVNVASRCGLTPQYTALEQLQRDLGPDRFTVLGFPSNQFGGQEPGSAEQIEEFCSTTYGVSFPLYAKTDVNGPDRSPLYAELTKTPYADGKESADISWNFEKFVISPQGSVVARFAPQVTPDDPAVLAVIEAQIGQQAR
jgi:glutathione peroxidase